MFCRVSFVRLAAVVAGLLVVAPAKAQPPFAFKLSPEMKIVYQTEHQTSVVSQTSEGKSSSASTVKQLKQWSVTGVDPLRVATLELTILKLEFQQTTSDGETLKFDSTKPTQSHPDLVKQLGELVGKPVLRIQMAANGQVKESQSLTGQKNLLRELPFFVTVPDELPKVGLRWQRDFAVTLEPPLGSGHGFKAIQSCAIRSLQGDLMTIDATTALQEDPTAAEDKISLLQYLPKGEVVLDWKRGLMVSAKMTIEQKIDKFAGEGSSYQFSSTYTEQLQDPSALQADKRR